MKVSDLIEALKAVSDIDTNVHVCIHNSTTTHNETDLKPKKILTQDFGYRTVLHIYFN